MRCPLCGTKMGQAGSQPVVDVCKSCRAAWFDGGELRARRPTGALLFEKAKRGLGRKRSCPRCDDVTLEPFVRDGAPFFACAGCEGLLLVEGSLARLEMGAAEREDEDDAGALGTAAGVTALGVHALEGGVDALAALALAVLTDQLRQLDDEDVDKRVDRLTR